MMPRRVGMVASWQHQYFETPAVRVLRLACVIKDAEHVRRTMYEQDPANSLRPRGSEPDFRCSEQSLGSRINPVRPGCLLARLAIRGRRRYIVVGACMHPSSALLYDSRSSQSAKMLPSPDHGASRLRPMSRIQADTTASRLFQLGRGSESETVVRDGSNERSVLCRQARMSCMRTRGIPAHATGVNTSQEQLPQMHARLADMSALTARSLTAKRAAEL